MLRDGKFIKEDPVKIGIHYVRQNKYMPTNEECFIQDALLHKSVPAKDAAGLGLILAGAAALTFSLVDTAMSLVRK